MGCCSNKNALVKDTTCNSQGSLGQHANDYADFPRACSYSEKTKSYKLIFDLKDQDGVLPIWVNKGKYIKFRVKGKWRIDPLLPWCSSEGFPSNTSSSYNYASLIAKIGENDNFVVKNDDVHLATESGPLSFYVYLPKQKIDPSGELTITIYDVEKLSLHELYHRLGWVESKETKKEKSNKLTEDEYDFAMHINDLRLNPSLFYQLFIERSSRRMIITKEYLGHKDHKITEELNINNIVNEKLNKIFNPDQIKALSKNNKKNTILNEIENINRMIKAHIDEATDSTSSNIIMKIIKKHSGINLLLAFLLDDSIKNELFNPKYKSIGVKIIKNFFEKENLIILALLTK